MISAVGWMVFIDKCTLDDLKMQLEDPLVSDTVRAFLLTLSASRGKFDFVDFLLNSGVSIDGEVLLKSDVSIDGEKILFFEEIGVTRVPLVEVAMEGHMRMIRYLLDRGANIERFDVSGSTPLMAASAWGRMRVVKELVQRGADVNAVDYREGMTPLMYAVGCRAARCRKEKVVRYLLDQGADKTIKDKDGWTAIQYVRKKDSRWLELLG